MGFKVKGEIEYGIKEKRDYALDFRGYHCTGFRYIDMV